MAHHQGATGAVSRYLPFSKEVLLPPDLDPAPYTFKRYPDSPRIPLPWRRRPTPAGTGETAHLPVVAAVLDSFAANRLAITPGPGTEWMFAFCRPLPSGGACFPGELYVVTAGDESLGAGVYHYDAAHHALVLLRRGDHGSEVDTALGGAGAAPVSILVACRRLKNIRKYSAFGYRLGCLDIGVVTGHLLVAAPVPAEVSFSFIDDAFDELLGLDPAVEGVYAVLRLAAGPAGRHVAHDGDRPSLAPVGVAGLGADRAAVAAVHPAVAELNRSSRLSDGGALSVVRALPAPAGPADQPVAARVPLPAVAWPGPRDGIRRRRSAAAFDGAPIGVTDLAGLLHHATAGYPSDVPGTADGRFHITLRCAAVAVDGLTSGIYRHEPQTHALVREPAGTDGAEVRTVLRPLPPALAAAAAVVFVTGSYSIGSAVVGDRWYRMLNMMAGVAAQRICLAAAATGLGARPNLAFDVDGTDRLLGLEAGQTTLVSVLVGNSRPGDGFLQIPLG